MDETTPTDEPQCTPDENPARDDPRRVAVSDGDPDKVRALINAGADLHYRSTKGYDALIDAVHGRDVLNDKRLLDLLRLLINQGVNLAGVSDYGESALRVLSRIGRFDAVRLLLDAGAPREHLEWTALHEAVVFGSIAEMKTALKNLEDLEARDGWTRTPYLLALLIGDVEKAKLLLDHGADANAVSQWGQPPLFYAIDSRRPEVVRWLIDRGADVNQADTFGESPLYMAACIDNLECVQALVEADAQLDPDSIYNPLGEARSRPVILFLLAAGADPANLSDEGKRVMLGLPPVVGDPFEGISPDAYRRDITRRFGRSNPERMDIPFWLAMVRADLPAYAPRSRFETEEGSPDQSVCGSFGPPVWCACRFGQSLTLLPDGRAIRVGGEHEDYYDPDFCIYNDVIVHHPDGSIAIYGYPEEVFPPTDFHTATLVGDLLYLIGSLSYHGTRQFGITPVYRLRTSTLQIEPIPTTGDAPGWIYKHRAALIAPRLIRVWGGKVVTVCEEGESHDPNASAFLLNLDTGVWKRE